MNRPDVRPGVEDGRTGAAEPPARLGWGWRIVLIVLAVAMIAVALLVISSPAYAAVSSWPFRF